MRSLPADSTKHLMPGALALLPLLFGACASNPAGGDTASLDYDGLASALRAKGAQVETGGAITQPFFSVPGRFLGVNGEDVQVFVYADESAAVTDAARVSSDGGSVGTVSLSWVAPPHFHRRDRVIVLYVGENATVRSALDSVLGPQFAGR